MWLDTLEHSEFTGCCHGNRLSNNQWYATEGNACWLFILIYSVCNSWVRGVTDRIIRWWNVIVTCDSSLRLRARFHPASCSTRCPLQWHHFLRGRHPGDRVTRRLVGVGGARSGGVHGAGDITRREEDTGK